MPKNRHRSDVLTPVAALTILLIAVLAGTSLRLLLRVQEGVARTDATQQFFDGGRAIVAHISYVASSIGETPSHNELTALSSLVSGMANVEHGLQYVEITDGDVTIFNEQAGPVLPDGTRQPILLPLMHDIEIGKKRLSIGAEEVDIVVFRREVNSPENRVIEVGIRHESVDTQERNAVTAVVSMYQLSLATVLIGFGACAILLVIMIRREQRRKDRRREEEHLAFSGVLANGIVHDFRNPMNAVRLDVQMLGREAARKDDCRQERIQTLSARVKRTMDRMDKVFKEFLYLSRPSPEGNDPLDICSCLRECVDILSPRAEQTKVSIECDLPDSALWIKAPAGAIRRAIVNVINNAMQFSKSGKSVDIRVRLERKEVVIDIMDRGPGIPRHERRHVFEMFVTNRPEGTGLGLFLARTAVEKCGGKITALERKGGGTRIRLRFPAAKQLEQQ